jgi:hypothetical protein
MSPLQVGRLALRSDARDQVTMLMCEVGGKSLSITVPVGGLAIVSHFSMVSINQHAWITPVRHADAFAVHS